MKDTVLSGRPMASTSPISRRLYIFVIKIMESYFTRRSPHPSMAQLETLRRGFGTVFTDATLEAAFVRCGTVKATELYLEDLARREAASQMTLERDTRHRMPTCTSMARSIPSVITTALKARGHTF
ncbi:hypothetical protein [Infectious spleen and kidney necrosis virus]|uniref:ORF015L n=2 Tax=Infectious spleen and kidney necrosis virus TaxID=180170 RepID=A0A140G0I9_ISKNV|nr:ORF015L [Infectious spleen and kidney necrosis virus]WHE26996.1 hypothetical protein [Infectious spleen and kidney necrosis virus]WNH14575.1 hypothetical protein [Infectious spleen and kidney necrosis virus]